MRCDNLGIKLENGASLQPCSEVKKGKENEPASPRPYSEMKKRTKNDPEDFISQLPCDVLANILSRLPIKEAGRTSILSSRWRYLWTAFTGPLDFDHSSIGYDLIFKLGLGSVSLPIERQKFVRWVNKVLKSLQKPTVKELRICFDVNSQYDLDSWVTYAIQKNVKRFVLDLTSYLPHSNYVPSYTFPFHLLNPSSFSHLTSLHLTFVNVTGEVVEHFLSNFSSLEVLSIGVSPSLVSLKVCGPSLKLKYLKVWRCQNLKVLQISAVNLVKFEYNGHKISNPFINVPSLNEVSFGGTYSRSIFVKMLELSSYLSRLQTLKVDLSLFFEERSPMGSIPELSNLTHLEITVSPDMLLCCVAFLKVCPLLHTFTLKLPYVDESSTKIWELAKDHSYRCLKVVELVGFKGFAADVGFLMYLIKSAEQLEKIIIDPCYCDPPQEGSIIEIWTRKSKQYRKAKERAVELGAKLPCLEFVVV